MKIVLISNESGYADNLETKDGISVSELFKQQLPKGRPQDYLIRVNRQPASADQVLQNGDRVSFTPTKLEGA